MKRVSIVLFALCLPAFINGCHLTQAEAKSSSGFENISQASVAKLRNTGTVQGENAGDLSVQIEIKAEPHKDNATAPGDFETDFKIRVMRKGQPVSDASVTVQAYKGPAVKLRFDEDEYEAEIKGYYGAYRVDITAGAERVEGVYLASPAIVTFSSHKHQERVSAGSDLKLSWKADNPSADRTQIEGDEFRAVTLKKGASSYTVSAASLDNDEENEFKITRVSEMELPGLTNGSSFMIEVENELELRLKR